MKLLTTCLALLSMVPGLASAGDGAPADPVARISADLQRTLAPEPDGTIVGAEPRPSASAVGITALISPPSRVAPWRRMDFQRFDGTGVHLGEGRILTNARLVRHPSLIEVLLQGAREPLSARVEHVCNACDLALLRLRDPGAAEDLPFLSLGELPVPEEIVEIHGVRPEDGEVASQKAMVLDVAMGPYAHSFDNLLEIQIDRPIQPADSGAPAVRGGKLVGLATVGIEPADTRGHLIPASIIRHFLEDVADGTWDGFPDLGIEVQPTRNESLRRFLGLEPGVHGALIQRIDYGSPAWGVLQPGDVLLAIDGVPLDEDLTAPLANGLRTDALHLVRDHQMGEEVELTFLRAGEIRTDRASLEPWSLLVPYLRHPTRPAYFVFGGFIFQPLGFDYLQVFRQMPPHLHRYVFGGNLVREDLREHVIITGILDHPFNDGYEAAEDMVVATVNGESPRDLAHLIRLVEEAEGPWLRIHTDQGLRIVLDLNEARSLTPSILASHGVAADRSPDL